MRLLVGFLIGAAVGLLNHWALVRWATVRRRHQDEPLKGIATLYVFRYLANAATLVAIALTTRDPLSIVAGAVGLTAVIYLSPLLWPLQQAAND